VQPGATTADGRFHHIDVKVTRPGVTLQARQGYYAHTTYRVFRDIDAVFRADTWDPDTADAPAVAATVTERDWLGGLTWRVAGPAAVLQLNYVRKTFLGVQPARNVLMANVQTVW